MLLYDFDEEKYKKTLKEEGREEGLKQGREQGLEQGREQGREQGLKEGEVRGLIRMFIAKGKKGKSYDQVLDELELADSPEYSALYEIVRKNALDYDENAIFLEYMASFKR